MSFTTSPEQVRQLVEEMYAAWSSHDTARLDPIFHEDAVHEDVAGGHMCHGIAEIKQLIIGAVGFSSDFRSTMISLTIAGDTAASEWIVEGTHTGPVATASGEIAASGRSFRLRGASLFLFREGRIARVTDYYDMATFLKQMGGDTLENPVTSDQQLGPCPKCGSTDRQAGRLMTSEVVPLRFEPDTVPYESDRGPVRGILCNQCKHLELIVS